MSIPILNNTNVTGTLSATSIVYAAGGNSSLWNSNYTTTNSNSAAWSNWQSVSANYALGSRYVKLSGDTMTGGLTVSGTVIANTVSTSAVDTTNSSAILYASPTTVTAFGNANTINLGYTNNTAGSNTFNISTQAQAFGTTKTVNVGTGSSAAGSTYVNLGSILGPSTVTINGTLAGSAISQDVFNTTATTVNFAGAATTLAIGASTGTATINNAAVTLANATALNINGTSPGIVTSSTGTASVFNTNALTGNLFGAATTVSIGASTGTTTVNNMFKVNYTGSTDSSIQVTGNNTKGGAGYHDFFKATNTGQTNPNKYLRLNSTGGLEILNSAYSANLLQITDDGAINVYGAGTAKVSNNDALSGYIGFGNNNTQIYDDGNTHFHARGSGNGMWVNTNNAQINLLTQSPVNGGSVGTGIAIGTTTLNGYVSINSSRTTAIAQPYGYLNSGGAGSTTGTSPNPYSLTCSSRIQCPEFDASSDERLKENIVPISLKDATSFVKGVSAVTFNWKDPENPGKKSGFIAQQVMRAGFDHLISVVGNAGVQEKIDADGFVSPASAALVMNYDQAIPYHSTIIKNLLERIEQLEAEVKALKK